MGLAVAGRPTNLRLPPEAAAMAVESDMYAICERVREISPRLFIVLIADSRSHAYAIMEQCEDGVDRLIFRVKELDGRVLNRLREILAMPLQERLAKLEKDEYRHREEAAEHQFEELYERLGRPMWAQLEHDGFIQRNRSYPKRGVKATSGR